MNILLGCGIAISALSMAFVLLKKNKLKHFQRGVKFLRNDGDPFGKCMKKTHDS